MVKSKDLPSEEKSSILALSKAGISQVKIAAQVSR